VIAATSATPVEKFGKDHWSLLAYVEDLCVNGREGLGEIDPRKLRCNPATHQTMYCAHSSPVHWKPSYGTRLAGFFDFEDRGDPEKAIAAGLQLRDHDDWDCLEDLEAAGYVEVLSLANGVVRMTKGGCEVASQLRTHKASGGHFAGFRLATESCYAKLLIYNNYCH
jgi:hypothetical protein